MPAQSAGPDHKTTAARFAREPGPIFLDVIRDRAGRTTRRDVLAALVTAGVPERTAASKWKSLLPLLKAHPRVRTVGQSYEWSDQPVTAREALGRLRRVYSLKTPAWLLDALADVVETGLGPEQSPPSSSQPVASTGAAAASDKELVLRAAQERQWRIDVVRAVAEVAMEVEEVVDLGADLDGVLERVRNRALAHSLEPIGQLGEVTHFDPTRHIPLAGTPDAGSTVLVARPGYTWRMHGEDVLIERALVRLT